MPQSSFDRRSLLRFGASGAAVAVATTLPLLLPREAAPMMAAAVSAPQRVIHRSTPVPLRATA